MAGQQDAFAPKRFVLPAFSLFWLVLVYISDVRGPIYGPDAAFAPYGPNTLIVVSADPALVRAGVTPGTVLDTSQTSYASRMRLRGAPKGTLLEIPIRTGAFARVVVTRAETLVTSHTLLERWIDIVSMTLSLLLAGYLGYRRPGVMIGALIMFIGGGGLPWPDLAAVLAGLPDGLYFAILWPLHIVAANFPALVLASFGIRLPGDVQIPEKRKAVRLIDAIVLLGLLLESLPYSVAVGRAYLAISAVVVVIACVLSLRYARPVDRGRVSVVFASVMLGGVGYAIGLIVESYTGPTVAFYAYLAASVMIVPIGVAYAILRHRVFDIGFVLNRTIVFGLTSAVVLVILAAMEFGAERYLSALTRAESVALDFAIALAVIVSVRTLHWRIDRFVDRVFFRKRHEDERALLDYSKEASYVTDSDILLDQAIAKIQQHTDARGAGLLIDRGGAYVPVRSFGEGIESSADDNDPAVLALKAWRKPLDPHQYATALIGALAIPMLARGRLLGILLLGERASGESYAPDEVDALIDFAQGVGSSLDVLSRNTQHSTETMQQTLIAMQAAIAALPKAIANELRGAPE